MHELDHKEDEEVGWLNVNLECPSLANDSYSDEDPKHRSFEKKTDLYG